MKKTLALILALIMCIGMFAACSDEKDPQKTPSADKGDEQTPVTPDQGETNPPDDSTTPPTPEVPSTTSEAYILVSTNILSIAPSYTLEDDPKPATWVKNTSGLTGYKYVSFSYLAPEGIVLAVKQDDMKLFSTGDLDETKIVALSADEVSGLSLGTEVLVEKDSAGSVVSVKASGKSVIGALTVTKDGDKYTVKVGDKVYLNAAAGTEKISEKVYDAVGHSAYYVSSATKKSVFAQKDDMLTDLSACFSNDTRDITAVATFYEECYDLGRMGSYEGYDIDGDGKLDMVVVNHPSTGKVTKAEGGAIQVGFLGDNHSYCGCNGWHTNTNYTSGTFEEGLAKDDIVIVDFDYKTGDAVIKKPTVVTGTLDSINGSAVKIAGKDYTLNNKGDLPYVNGKTVTQYETDTQQAAWTAAVGKEVTVRTDDLGNIVHATLPAAN